jgi:gamma-glutamylcyclotransferase (GGCT)/AIG2-like uncharacterized protein YtfP
MTLYFAYGSNMHRGDMAERCAGAQPLGRAALHGWRYQIMQGGYASIARDLDAAVHGVLWQVDAEGLAKLDAYEDLASGLYTRAMLTVRRGAIRSRALVYVGGTQATGKPLPDYQERVIAAAEEWKLPASYLRELRRWRAP